MPKALVARNPPADLFHINTTFSILTVFVLMQEKHKKVLAYELHDPQPEHSSCLRSGLLAVF
jgi:hypothetical protein